LRTATAFVVLLALVAVLTVGAPGAAGESCLPTLDAGSRTRIDQALRARRDLWGEALLASPNGPTYDEVRRYLPPLLLAKAAQQTRLTASGVHYLAFSQPDGPQGAGSAALHVADGSQILSNRSDGDALTIRVGRRAGERYGACLTRLTSPRLVQGYLPILQTSYVDTLGVRYRQESFAARSGAGRTLASFVRLIVDARSASGIARVSFVGEGRTLSFSVRPGGVRTVYVIRPVSGGTPKLTGRRRWDESRASLIDYWRVRLTEGASLVVPERRVMDAQRALLIQNLGLTWRYSVGNPYQQFSFPEGVDVAQVMAARGFAAVARSILVTSLSRRPTPYPNWKIGQKLVGSATYYRFTRDRSYIRQVTPVLRGYVTQLGRQLDASGRGLLQRERYSSDIADSVYGLHSQAVAWQGLRSMGDVWSETGDVALATRCRKLAAKLGTGLTAAVRESQTWLPDGSLFIPVKLLDEERPYGSVTESRSGSYWNLVAPYAFASGLFSPGSVEAEGVLRYLFNHGSRFLGLVRAGAYALYGRAEPFPTSGTDQVYGLNVSRLLADNDRPEQLVLSLYGQLAAGMTPGTFIAGEAASIAPLTGEYHRSMYLPPNGAANATFLETLRLLLVHETTDSRGRPVGLELAHATPRGWLAPGRRIAVRATPTSFGPLSYTIRSAERALHVSIDVPRSTSLTSLSLRLRLPRGSRLTNILLDGRPVRSFDRGTGIIELPIRPGRSELVAQVERGANGS
jgi:hypothetical protein